jgi:hypothetical protein
MNDPGSCRKNMSIGLRVYLDQLLDYVVFYVFDNFVPSGNECPVRIELHRIARSNAGTLRNLFEFANNILVSRREDPW